MNYRFETFIQARFSMFFLFLFYYLFLPLRYKKHVTISVLSVAFILNAIVDYFQQFYYLDNLALLMASLINVIIVQGTNLILSYYRDFRGLFNGITVAVYNLIGNVIVLIYWVNTHKFIEAVLLQCFIHTVLMVSLIMVVKKRYIFVLENRKNGWAPLCLIPALFYLTVYSLVTWPENLVNNPKNSLTVVLTLSITIASYIIIAKLFYQQRLNDNLERNNDFLETYSSSLRREVELIRASEEKTAILRHDLRHTNNLIISYLQTGKTEQIYELLDRSNLILENSKPKLYCENIALNSIIANTAQIAKENHVNFNIIVDVPQTLATINEFELATILSNLLDNALNATIKLPSEDRNIQLKLYQVKNQLLLDISNTFDGNCEISPVTGLPISQNGEGHGYGLRSVQTYIKKWNAIFEYKIENKFIFHIRILTTI